MMSSSIPAQKLTNKQNSPRCFTIIFPELVVGTSLEKLSTREIPRQCSMHTKDSGGVLEISISQGDNKNQTIITGQQHKV